ncbi:MAG TPA: hypothetical protein VF821_32050, partial [Lentzea sp.]
AYLRKRDDAEKAWVSAPDRGIAYTAPENSDDDSDYGSDDESGSDTVQVHPEPWNKTAFLLFGHAAPQFFQFNDSRYGAMTATGAVYAQIVEDWFLAKTGKTLGDAFTEAATLTCSPAAMDGPGSAAFDALGKMGVRRFFGATTPTKTGTRVITVGDGGRFKVLERAADGKAITTTVIEPAGPMAVAPATEGLSNTVTKPVAVAEIDVVRPAAPVNEVRTSNDRGQVHFDVRRIELGGVTVREISLELRTNFATGSEEKQRAFWSTLDRAVETHLNSGLVLPNSGDQLRVRLIHVETGTAHATVLVDNDGAWGERRTEWTIDSTAEVLVQHVADLLGAFDDTAAKPWSGPSLTQAQLAALDDQHVPGGLKTLAHKDLPDNTEVLWVSGTDAAGRSRRFTPGQVTKTLVQRDGQTVGALFTDMPAAAGWISMRQRENAVFLTGTTTDKVLPVRIEGVDDDSTSIFVLHGGTRTGQLEVGSIGKVQVDPGGFVDVALDTGVLGRQPDDSLVVIWACNIAALPKDRGFLHDVQKVLASRNVKRRVAGGTKTVWVYPPTTGRGDGTKPSISVSDGGHFEVVGDTTAADDTAVVAELVAALENEWSYADQGPLPAKAKIPVADRARTLA